MRAWDIRAMVLAPAIVLAALPAFGQAPQSQTTRLIVAYAAGGTGDVVARILSDRLAAALGHNVVVENRAGASGAIASRSVVAAPPDGHTLLVGQTGEVAINQHFITAFLDLNLKGDESRRAYLHVRPEKSNDGKWPLAQGQSVGGKFSDGADYWKGFQRRWAVGMEMHCSAAH